MAAPSAKSNQSPLPWLKIITAEDPQFQGKLQSIFGQSANSPLVKAVAPFGIVLTHAGSKNLQGISMVWTLNTGAKSIKHKMFYNLMNDPSAVLMHPGESLFFCPLRSVNFLSKSSKAQATAGETVLANSADAAVLNRFLAADSVTVDVDLIVASDGTSAGPDKGKLLKTTVQDKAAYADMRSECLEYLAQGKPVLDWLKPIAAKHGRIDPETGFPDHYLSTQIAVANRWIALLSNPQTKNDFAYVLGLQTPDQVFPFTIKGGLQ